MARTYKRDSRGRFAGGGGGGSRGGGAKLPAPRARKVGGKPQRRQGLLIQRGSLASSKRKLAAKDPADQTIRGQLSLRSQKGAVTRGQKALAAAQQSGRIRLGARSEVLRPGARKAAQPKGKIDAGKAAARASGLRARAAQLERQGNALMSGGRRDGAAVNASLSSRTRRNETSAGFRGLEMSRQAAALRNRADRVEQRAAQSAAKAAREAAKPKRARTPESLRMSRAKRIVKEREMKISGTYRQWQNSVATQQRALDYYAAVKSSRRRK